MILFDVTKVLPTLSMGAFDACRQHTKEERRGWCLNPVLSFPLLVKSNIFVQVQSVSFVKWPLRVVMFFCLKIMCAHHYHHLLCPPQSQQCLHHSHHTRVSPCPHLSPQQYVMSMKRFFEKRFSYLLQNMSYTVSFSFCEKPSFS